VIGSLLGTRQVCEAWRAIGREARVVDRSAVPWLPQGFFASDRDLVEVDGSPVAVVSLRLHGVVGPRQLLTAGAYSLKIGGIPVARRDVLPVQLHFLVRRADAGSAAPTHLVQVGRGWFSRQRTGLAWDGPHAALLAGETGLLAALDPEIGPDDALTVKPEDGLVRIVLARRIVAHLGLAAGADLARVDRPPLGPALLGAIERIAALASSR
jgi:hypothetical protein